MRHYLLLLQTSWPLLGFGFLGIFWGNFGQSFLISWYGAPIQESLGLSASAYGTIYSLATLASACLIMLSGGLIDRWPLQRFALCSALGLLLACGLMAVSDNPWWLLSGLFMLRFCGQGLLPHMALTTMARYFSYNRGKALSISTSGLPVGEVVLPVIVVGLIAAIGWRWSWLVIGVSIVLVYLPLVYWLLARARFEEELAPAGDKSQAAPEGGRRELLHDHRFWLVLPAAMMAPFIITGVFIQQGFVIEAKGWTSGWLASCFVIYGIVHWSSSMMVGILIDRYSARHLLRWMLVPLVLAMLSLAWLEGQWVAPLFMILLGMTIGTVNPVSSALWAEVYGTAKLGAIRSLISALMILSTATSPVLYGVLIDSGLGVEVIFGATAVLVLLALLLSRLSYAYEPANTRP